MLFPRNIDTLGRLLRGAGALLLAIAGGFIWAHSHGTAIGFFAGAVFMGFEAARGWCAARACGIKTKY